MSKKLRIASAISIAATFITTLLSTGGSGAAAQDLSPRFGADVQIPASEAPGASAITTHSAQAVIPAVERAIPQPEVTSDDGDAALNSAANAPVAASLAALVDATPAPAALSDELNCLAGAIYFEAKSETMAGQLAVGRVIVARANSGRFPASYCGVVYQPSQFSFVRGHAMPAVNKAGPGWTKAVKIAMIADRGAWKSPVEGAMFFHAARVSPSWGKTRMARIDNHIFYR
ncbi:cell wall hydrolase [Novosphingobium sp. KCTC 2891]|uniref:cell wall hydrolase n=1 Tax=Novosphingobium sp. KCTC 2891 TaxID=2989730 RepID=UPI002221A6F8|nr:cell wall hydrolase [Novosphingobium sp. KCTC 2891]MCW1382270.1 cell wall hydrolase [Novosphingobium sp. KCTC 2891]